MKRGARPRTWLDGHDRRRFVERRGATTARDRWRWPSAALEPPPARPARRSGTFVIQRDGGPTEAPRGAASGLGLVAYAIFGLAAFPLVGAAFLGHLLPPLAFILLAISAAGLFFGAVTRLEPPWS